MRNRWAWWDLNIAGKGDCVVLRWEKDYTEEAGFVGHAWHNVKDYGNIYATCLGIAFIQDIVVDTGLWQDITDYGNGDVSCWSGSQMTPMCTVMSSVGLRDGLH